MKENQQGTFESCFDKDLSTQQSGGFWRRLADEEEIRKILLMPTLHSGRLYKSRFEQDRVFNFTLKQGVLFYCSEKEPSTILGIAKLSFHHMKAFQTQQNTNSLFGLKLFSGVVHTKLYSESRDEVILWQRNLAQHVVNRDFFTRFELREMLGEGGFSQVYKVVDKKTNRSFAAKVIKHKMIFSDRRGVLLMKQEIDIMRELNHPNIVKLHEVHEVHNAVILIMEQVEGQELKKVSFTLNYKEVLTITRSLLSVAAYFESLNIVHRDLKPSNIMICSNGGITLQSTKVLDFGLAAFLSEKLLLTRCGTPGYIAPEVLTQSPKSNHLVIKPNVDIYSIGVILYEMIYKVNPFKDSGKYDSKKVVSKNASGIIDYSRPTVYKDEFRENEKQMLKSMLAANESDRSSASELILLPIIAEGLKTKKNADYTPILEENAVSQLSFVNYRLKSFKNRFLAEDKMSKRGRPAELVLDIGEFKPDLDEFSPVEKNVMSPLKNPKKYRRKDEDNGFELFSKGNGDLDARFRGKPPASPLYKLDQDEEPDFEENETNKERQKEAVSAKLPKKRGQSEQKNGTRTAVEESSKNDGERYRGLFVIQKCDPKQTEAYT